VAEDAHQSNRITVFLHIPKTAGTTLRTILSLQFWPNHVQTMYSQGKHRERADRLVRLANDQPNRVRVITGHIGYGIHSLLPRRVDYITVVRDPVARVISMYEHIRRSAQHPYYKDVQTMTLVDYVESEIDESASNSQTRFLSSVKLTHELAGIDDMGGSGMMSNEEMLAEAKRNVSDNILVTGLTERFDESLLLLREHLGWKRLYYAQMNRRRRATNVAPPTVLEREAVLRRNELDSRLYDHAQDHFVAQLDTLASGVREELPGFAARNRYLGPFYSYPARVIQKSWELLDR